MDKARYLHLLSNTYKMLCCNLTKRLYTMKPDIHPENYRTVLFFDSSVGEGWLIRSCADTHGKTMKWHDGNEYPVFMLESSSASHPVYTGKQRTHSSESLASRFNQRYQGMLGALKKEK